MFFYLSAQTRIMRMLREIYERNTYSVPFVMTNVLNAKIQCLQTLLLWHTYLKYMQKFN